MRKRSLLLAVGTLAVRPASALYDPKPIGLLELAPGTWSGSLTYRDYQKPDKMVRLPTTMVASLVAPEELALYYVFDDGPGKTVYSYERMKVDLAAGQLLWSSGTTKPSRSEYQITSASSSAGKSALAFEKRSDAGSDRYSLEVTKSTWSLTKYELQLGGAETLRNRYEFSRREA
jgi:hypothetical protein